MAANYFDRFQQGDSNWQQPHFRQKWEDYQKTPYHQTDTNWGMGYVGDTRFKGFERQGDRGFGDRYMYDKGLGQRWPGANQYQYGGHVDRYGNFMRLGDYGHDYNRQWGAREQYPRGQSWDEGLRAPGSEKIFGATEKGRSDIDSGFYGESKRGTSGNTWRNYGKRGFELPYYEGWWRPRADIFDEDRNIRVEFELPGVPKDNIGLTVGEDFIILQCIKPESHRERKGFYYQNERHFGNFYRKLELPEFIDTSKCSSVLQNGVLKVTCPKSQSGEGGTKSTEGTSAAPVKNKIVIREMSGQAAPGGVTAAARITPTSISSSGTTSATPSTTSTKIPEKK